MDVTPEKERQSSREEVHREKEREVERGREREREGERYICKDTKRQRGGEQNER